MTAISQLYSPSIKVRLATQGLIDAMTESNCGLPLALVVGEADGLGLVPLLPLMESTAVFLQMVEQLKYLCDMLLVKVSPNVLVQ